MLTIHEGFSPFCSRNEETNVLIDPEKNWIWQSSTLKPSMFPVFICFPWPSVISTSWKKTSDWPTLALYINIATRPLAIFLATCHHFLKPSSCFFSEFSAGKPQTHPSSDAGPLDGVPATASPKKRAQLDVDLSPVSMKESPNRSQMNQMGRGKKKNYNGNFNGSNYDRTGLTINYGIIGVKESREPRSIWSMVGWGHTILSILWILILIIHELGIQLD